MWLRGSPVRLISWNLAKRRAYMPQVEVLARRHPDVVALQEVSYLRAAPLAAALRDVGLTHAAYSRDDVTEPTLKHGILIASRWPLELQCAPAVPIPESVLCVEIDSPAGPVALISVHAPNSGSYGLRKVETFEALHDALIRPHDGHRILCGDLNSPQREDPDGTVITFGQRIRRDGSAGLQRDGGRKDRAERSVLLGLAAHDLTDVFRNLYGHGVAASSWRQFRLDHVFASASLAPTNCRYLNGVRAERLSDHAAVEATFDPPART